MVTDTELTLLTGLPLEAMPPPPPQLEPGTMPISIQVADEVFEHSRS